MLYIKYTIHLSYYHARETFLLDNSCGKYSSDKKLQKFTKKYKKVDTFC